MTFPLLHADVVPHIHELATSPAAAVVALAAIAGAIIFIRRRKA